MKPWVVLDEARAPGGTHIVLEQRDREYAIFAGRHMLMSSRTHASEEALAAIGCAQARTLTRPHVLVGGLGLGFTLRAALDLLPPTASVTVCELVPNVVVWNRRRLGPAAAQALDDPRVRVEIGDVSRLLHGAAARFDAVLLDVDNGPAALTADGNTGLYSDPGIAAARAALTPAGVMAVWSAGEDRAYERRLRRAGFAVHLERVRAAAASGGRHTIYVASSVSRARRPPARIRRPPK